MTTKTSRKPKIKADKEPAKGATRSAKAIKQRTTTDNPKSKGF